MITSEHALSSESVPEGSPEKAVPRSFLSISRPTTHPDAPDRSGFVKGTYESAELIREIPLFPENPEMNPVEWLMITRSDPGGGIPKFLVERGTPGSVVGDVPKFINWAIQQGDVPPFDEKETAEEAARQNESTAVAASPEKQAPGAHTSASSKTDEATASTGAAAVPDTATSNHLSSSPQSHVRKPSQDQSTGGPAGYLASVRNAVGETFNAYLPHFGNGGLEEVSSDSSSDISDASSVRTFGTAVGDPEHNAHADRHTPGAPTAKGANVASDGTHSDLSQSTRGVLAADTPIPTARVDAILAELDIRKPNNSSERDLVKLSEKRRSLDARIAAARISAQEQRRTLTELAESPAVAGDDARKDATKDQQSKAEKAAKEFEKQEAKYRSEIGKLEDKRDKLAIKIEERQRKDEEKDELKRAKQQRDEWKDRVKVMERENGILRKQVEGLLKDNEALVSHIGDEGVVRKILRDGYTGSAQSREGSLREKPSSIKSGNSGEKA